jgi:hypothetical protein
MRVRTALYSSNKGGAAHLRQPLIHGTAVQVVLSLMKRRALLGRMWPKRSYLRSGCPSDAGPGTPQTTPESCRRRPDWCSCTQSLYSSLLRSEAGFHCPQRCHSAHKPTHTLAHAAKCIERDASGTEIVTEQPTTAGTITYQQRALARRPNTVCSGYH